MPSSPPFACAITISIVSVALLMDGSGMARFFIAASLFNFAWNATFPYQMGVLAQQDRTGAVAILSLLVQLGGSLRFRIAV